MPYNIQCPTCQNSFVVEADLFGKLIKCQHCKAPMRIPSGLDLPTDSPFSNEGSGGLGAPGESYTSKRKKKPNGVSPVVAMLLGGALGGFLVLGGFLIWKLAR